MPNSTRFKRTDIKSAIVCLNKVDNSLSGLMPKKFKKGIKKVPLGEKLSVEILQDLNKTVNKKPRPITKQQYLRASVENKALNRNYYKHMRNLYDPLEDYMLEEKISRNGNILKFNLRRRPNLN